PRGLSGSLRPVRRPVYAESIWWDAFGGWVRPVAEWYRLGQDTADRPILARSGRPAGAVAGVEPAAEDSLPHGFGAAGGQGEFSVGHENSEANQTFGQRFGIGGLV